MRNEIIHLLAAQTKTHDLPPASRAFVVSASFVVNSREIDPCCSQASPAPKGEQPDHRSRVTLIKTMPGNVVLIMLRFVLQN